MAIDFCSSEPPSLCASPRISFSHDLRHEPTNQNYSFQPDSDSTSDFNFWVGGGRTGNEPSPADELFSGGLIMPLQVQEKFENPKQASFKPKAHDFTATYLPPPSPVFSNFEASKHEIEAANKSQKSFWKIKRSSSVNCDGSHKRSSFWPLPTLPRSNSTGSVPKLSSKQTSQKQSNKTSASNSSSSSSSSSSNSYSQKPPLRKNYGGAYGNNNGVRISPVLNVPPPYISRGTSSLFGLGSLFRNGKDKKNIKK